MSIELKLLANILRHDIFTLWCFKMLQVVCRSIYLPNTSTDSDNVCHVNMCISLLCNNNVMLTLQCIFWFWSSLFLSELSEFVCFERQSNGLLAFLPEQTVWENWLKCLLNCQQNGFFNLHSPSRDYIYVDISDAYSLCMYLLKKVCNEHIENYQLFNLKHLPDKL